MIPSSLPGAAGAAGARAALDSLLASGPLPRLVWAGTVDGAPERLELSGRVSATWASKIANLLVEEIDAGPGTRIQLDLPQHWRTLTWALGAWLCGATVVVAGQTGIDDDAGAAWLEPAPDVLVTTSPELAQLAVGRGTEAVVLVPLKSFALRVLGDLPAGVLDGAADVAAQPDDLGPVQPARGRAVALEAAGQNHTFDELFGGLDGLPGLDGLDGLDGLPGLDRLEGSDEAEASSLWWGASAVREWVRGARVDLTSGG